MASNNETVENFELKNSCFKTFFCRFLILAILFFSLFTSLLIFVYPMKCGLQWAERERRRSANCHKLTRERVTDRKNVMEEKVLIKRLR